MLGMLAGGAGRLGLLCVILSICPVATSRAQSVDSLYEKAKLEKTVSLYGAGPSDPFKRWIEDFQKKYLGVAVNFTGGLSNLLDKRIDQQLADKSMEADVGIFQTIQDFVRWKKAGVPTLFKPEDRGDRPGVQGRGRRIHDRLRQYGHLRLQHADCGRGRRSEICAPSACSQFSPTSNGLSAAQQCRACPSPALSGSRSAAQCSAAYSKRDWQAEVRSMATSSFTCSRKGTSRSRISWIQGVLDALALRCTTFIFSAA